VHHIEQVCFRAVPIVALITFLIGCIISRRGIFHSEDSARIFVVDMRVLVLREIGVLLVAIMVAGRSGSAYTADSLHEDARGDRRAAYHGIRPDRVLVLPRMLALIIALPILAFLGAMRRYGRRAGGVAVRAGSILKHSCFALRDASQSITSSSAHQGAGDGGRDRDRRCVEGLAARAAPKSLGHTPRPRWCRGSSSSS